MIFDILRIFLFEMKFTPKYLRYLNFFTATGLSAAYIAGKTLNARNLRDDLEVKTDDNKPLPVPPKIKFLVNQVLEDMKLDEKEKERIKLFMCKNNDIRHVGFSIWGVGAFLGIPQHFLFDENDHHNFTVELNGKIMPKNAPEFESLKTVMCLSDDAKKFAIAQEIYHSQHTDIVPCGVLPFAVMIKCNILSVILDKVTKPTLRANSVQHHCFIFFMGAWFYTIVYDILSVFGDGDSDFLASELGESYVKGGIEYYIKMIERNKIMKSINKNAPYSKNGDKMSSYIRTKHMSLSRRIVYLRNILNGKKESVWKYVFM